MTLSSGQDDIDLRSNVSIYRSSCRVAGDRVAPLRMGVRRAPLGPTRFRRNKLSLKGSLCRSGQPFLVSFERLTIFCSSLVRTEILLFQNILLFPRDFAVSRFEQKYVWVCFPKDAQKGCPDPQRLPLKGSLLLLNLVGPGYLKVPF